MKKSIKNSYAYKTILVIGILLGLALMTIGGLGICIYGVSGLLTGSEHLIKDRIDKVTRVNETRAIESVAGGRLADDLENSNFHYAVVEGDNSQEALKSIREHKAKIIAGNIYELPGDIDISANVYRAGDNSTYEYSETSSGFLGIRDIWAVTHTNNKEIPHVPEDYALSEDEHSAYIKSEGIWYKLSKECEPQVRITAEEDGDSISEYYDLDAVNPDWFCESYDIDRNETELKYEYIFQADSDSQAVIYGDDIKKLDTSKAVSETDESDNKEAKDGGEDEIILSDSVLEWGSAEGVFSEYAEDESVRSYTVVSYVGQKDGNYPEGLELYDNSGYKLVKEKEDMYVKVTEKVLKFESYLGLIIAAAVVGFLIYMTGLVLLLFAAGHHEAPHPGSREENYILLSDGTGVIEKRALDHIPMDLYLLIVLSLMGAGFAVGVDVGRWWISWICFALISALVLVPFIVSLTVNIKVGGFLKKTIIGRVLSFIGRVFKSFGRYFKEAEGVGGLKKRAWITYAVLLVIHIAGFMAMASYYSSDMILVLFVLFLTLWGVIAYGLSRVLAGFARVKSGAQKVAGGDLSWQIDTGNLPADMEQLAGYINNITNGLDVAVDERMKSDRMQTELITNVSHDIRTPLTSIINYVDLLSKEDLESEKAREYVEVLSRQAQKLKKLITDLIDASKASSGAMEMNMDRINASVLLTQAVGEYSEKLSEKNINMVVESPKEDIYINADPQRLWRVFDNLLGNAAKYGQEGTRAYVDITEPDRSGISHIIFRNISAAPLHISGEELMQRFVRGDESRSTEGSGLGLSIARSLTELMGGSFELSIDGDLFKVIIGFPVMKEVN